MYSIACKINRFCALGLFTLILPVAGCVEKRMRTEPTLPDFALSCVAVLPAASAVTLNDRKSAEEEKALEEGLYVLDESLKRYFGGRSDIRLISDGQGLKQDGKMSLHDAGAAAEKLSCNAVLEVKLRRYKERVGGKYTAREPAAAAFDYRLLAMPDGEVLCRGGFDEEQQSLMENLFNFTSGTENAFTWIKVDKLMYQGVRDRLDTCSYLAEE